MYARNSYLCDSISCYMKNPRYIHFYNSVNRHVFSSYVSKTLNVSELDVRDEHISNYYLEIHFLKYSKEEKAKKSEIFNKRNKIIDKVLKTIESWYGDFFFEELENYNRDAPPDQINATRFVYDCYQKLINRTTKDVIEWDGCAVNLFILSTAISSIENNRLEQSFFN